MRKKGIVVSSDAIYQCDANIVALMKLHSVDDSCISRMKLKGFVNLKSLQLLCNCSPSVVCDMIGILDTNAVNGSCSDSDNVSLHYILKKIVRIINSCDDISKYIDYHSRKIAAMHDSEGDGIYNEIPSVIQISAASKTRLNKKKGVGDVMVSDIIDIQYDSIHKRVGSSKTYNDIDSRLGNNGDGLDSVLSIVNAVEESPYIKEGTVYKLCTTKDAWVLRDISIDILHSSITLQSMKQGLNSNSSSPSSSSIDSNTIWLSNTYCILQLLAGEHYGKRRAIRLFWPEIEYELLISTDGTRDKDYMAWYQHLSLLVQPSYHTLNSRKNIFNSSHSSSLCALSIKSYCRKVTSLISRSDILIMVTASTEPKELLNHDDIRRYGIGYINRKYPHSSVFYYGDVHPKNRFKWDLMVQEFPERHQEELRRFLIAKNYDTSQAIQALYDHILWRRLYLPIDPTKIVKELSRGTCFVRNKDREGHPVIYFFIDKHDTDSRDLDNTILMLLYRMEQAVSRLPDRNGTVTLLLALEMRGNRMHHKPWDAILLKNITDILRKNYPGRLHRILLYRPFASNSRLRISSRIKEYVFIRTMSKVVVSKVAVVTKVSDLSYYIEPKYLLEVLGGTDQFDFNKHVSMSNNHINGMSYVCIP